MVPFSTVERNACKVRSVILERLRLKEYPLPAHSGGNGCLMGVVGWTVGAAARK